jgi:serine/threonine protein kinase
MKLVMGLIDLLEKGLTLDPTKRLTVVEAFRHPFFASSAK